MTTILLPPSNKEISDFKKMESAKQIHQDWLDGKPQRLAKRFKALRGSNPSIAQQMLKDNPDLAILKVK